MSCIPPFEYKNRFYNYLKTVFVEETLENSSDKNDNNNNINKKIQNVDKYGAISSSLYKNYQENESDEKFTEEESIQKL